MGYNREEHVKFMIELKQKDLNAYEKYMAEYEKIADDVIGELSSEDIEEIRLNPRPAIQHFDLGHFIRNKYIHGSKLEFASDSDLISRRIVRMIVEKLLPEYEAYPLMFDLFDHGDVFVSVHRFAFVRHRQKEYFSLLDTVYPSIQEASKVEDAFNEDNRNAGIACFDNTDERNKVRKAVWKKTEKLRFESLLYIADGLWDFEAYEKRANELDVSEEVTMALKDFCRNVIQEHGYRSLFVPGSILLLPAFDGLMPEEQADVLKDLDVLFDQWPQGILENIPEEVFAQREVAQYMLGKDGTLLAKMPQWQNDKELVKIAVSNGYTAARDVDQSLMEDREMLRAAFANATTDILNDEFYEQYADDDELVWLAVKADSSNLADASDRLRDDKELVLFAIKNTDDVGVLNFYDDLSPHMQEDRDVVLAIAACPSIPFDFLLSGIATMTKSGVCWRMRICTKTISRCLI